MTGVAVMLGVLQTAVHRLGWLSAHSLECDIFLQSKLDSTGFVIVCYVINGSINLAI